MSRSRIKVPYSRLVYKTKIEKAQTVQTHEILCQSVGLMRSRKLEKATKIMEVVSKNLKLNLHEI